MLWLIFIVHLAEAGNTATTEQRLLLILAVVLTGDRRLCIDAEVRKWHGGR